MVRIKIRIKTNLETDFFEKAKIKIIIIYLSHTVFFIIFFFPFFLFLIQQNK
jgi:hypothetical protein